uniref:Calmodulin-binding protein-like protein 1 n=1 Tax=Brassica rapa subsp. chinensis TaxID=93385 RepID=X5CJG6_BRARC|nr:calmodulin-binding protein-like protein 1 [Brassica rapa subsp. chinensis]
MAQRKTTCQAIKSFNLQPETRFGPEMMMMMKRTKPKRKLKESHISQPGKTQSPPSKHDLVAKRTGRSPNYMKGTSSSEARMENKKIFNQKNQTGKKESRSNKPGSRMVRSLTKAPSFKRCSQRATCSSTLKDSKFPEYLMVNHGGSDDGEVSGTSVLRVCPYMYCSLNGHLPKQCPPLKSFISSRRQSLKSQKSVKMEASKDDSVEMYVEEEKECENADGGTCEVDVETQISETVSVGAPRSETDSDEYSEIVKFSEVDDGIELQESDLEETLVADSFKEVQETSCEVDDNSDSAEMVRFLEGDHDTELKESDMEETLADDSVKQIQEEANREEDVDQSCSFNSEAIGMMMNSEADDADKETLKDSREESQDQTEAVLMIEESAKVPCNQEGESDATVSWTIIKCKKPVAETEDLREFNPREPSYLPVFVDADAEKVDLKHQDMDERRNSEDWMFDHALQRAVTKLSSAKKRKVALLVEAFETVKPVVQHGREHDPVLSYGRHIQTSN